MKTPIIKIHQKTDFMKHYKSFQLLFIFISCCISLNTFSQAKDAIQSSKTKQEIVPLSIGTSLPLGEKKLLDVSGKEVSIINAERKNGVLVVFSCNTCPYVVKNEQRILNIIDMAVKLDIGVIILNSNEAYREHEDSYNAMKEYAIEKGLTCFYVVDEKNAMADAFGAKRTPECFLFDKTRILAYHGAIDDNPSDAENVKRMHLLEAMKELSSGKDVTVKESKSVGCGIKRKS